MIVKTGRRAIVNGWLNGTGNRTFKFFLESKQSGIGELTTPDMTYDSSTGKIQYMSGSTQKQIAINDIFTLDSNSIQRHIGAEDNLTISIHLFVGGTAAEGEQHVPVPLATSDPAKGKVFVAGGLICDDVLISRFTFKDTAIDSDSEYELNYTLYF